MRWVLVTYGTKAGSTLEVAESVAAHLRRRLYSTDLEPAGSVTDLSNYDGVVLGGSIYMGRWHPDARRFLKRHRETLARLPFAVFALGPLTAAEHDMEGSRRQLDHALEKVPEVEPVAIAVFGGVVDPRKLTFPFSHMPPSDARDWEAIHEWADEVADLLEREVAVPA
jgi:menaquinone-dependent protoporphyrinogen oxidase